ncbi:MAG TPA: hypothetical protein VGD60_11780 [Candidatus Acidoferrales bacterium]
MNARTVILSAGLFLVLGAVPAFAQSTATPSSAKIQQRKDNQQDRIANGVNSGQLTPRETANLESKEAGLNKEERNMRSQDNGHLTSADKAKLNRQQNHLSNQIYDKKHNARTRPQ